MRAVTYRRYGAPDVLRVEDVPTPVPAAGQVLVRVHAVSLNRSDWEGLRGRPAYARIMGLRRPRRHVLGSDVAGCVEAVGDGVTRFRPGDDVYADTVSHLGGLAEYVCLPERLLAVLPEHLSHEQAAALPQAGAIAVQAILEQQGGVRPGQQVLVNGAGGGSGTFIVQLAKLRGAEVTAVDTAEKLEHLRALGADHVVDGLAEDFTRNGRTYDLVLDLVAHRSVLAYRRSLAPGGRYLYVGGSVPTLLQVLLLWPLVGRRRQLRLRLLVVRQGVEHLQPLVDLLRDGRVEVVVDRRYTLDEAAEALRYLGENHAKGKVLVVVPQP